MCFYLSMLLWVGKSHYFALLSVLLGVYWKKFYLPQLIQRLVHHAAQPWRRNSAFSGSPLVPHWMPERIVAVTCDTAADKWWRECRTKRLMSSLQHHTTFTKWMWWWPYLLLFFFFFFWLVSYFSLYLCVRFIFSAQCYGETAKINVSISLHF